MGGLHPGGIISRIIYLLANGWAYIWGGGLKLGGNKVRFYDILMNRTEKISFFQLQSVCLIHIFFIIGIVRVPISSSFKISHHVF